MTFRRQLSAPPQPARPRPGRQPKFLQDPRVVQTQAETETGYDDYHDDEERAEQYSDSKAAGIVAALAVACVVVLKALEAADLRELRFIIGRFPGPLLYILALNLAPFIAWRIPGMSRFMHRHFAASWETVVDKRRWHNLLTAVFSHQGSFHLLFNMMALSAVGPLVVGLAGPAGFAAFYTGAALASSAIGLAISRIGTRAHRWPIVRRRIGLGASGAVYAIVFVTLLARPDSQWKLFFLLQMSGETLLYSLLAFDIGGLLLEYFKASPLGHGTHLGGALCGILAWYFWLKPILERMRASRRVATRRIVL